MRSEKAIRMKLNRLKNLKKELDEKPHWSRGDAWWDTEIVREISILKWVLKE